MLWLLGAGSPRFFIIEGVVGVRWGIGGVAERAAVLLREGVVVVGVHVLHLKVAVLVFLPRDGSASVADLAEGVVEIGAIEADPVSAAVTLGIVAVCFPHDGKINII